MHAMALQSAYVTAPFRAPCKLISVKSENDHETVTAFKLLTPLVSVLPVLVYLLIATQEQASNQVSQDQRLNFTGLSARS
jgi:hypothetical protein